MQLTLVERDDNKVEYKTDVTTIAGVEFRIVTNNTGMYKIVSLGKGAYPAITEDTFTSLYYAKEALINFQRVNEAQINKKQLIKDQVERRKKEWQEQQ